MLKKSWDGKWKGKDFHAFQCVWQAAKNKANYFAGRSQNFLDLPTAVVDLCAKFLSYDVYAESYDTYRDLQNIVDNRVWRFLDQYIRAKYKSSNKYKVMMMLIHSIEKLDSDTVSFLIYNLPREFFGIYTDISLKNNSGQEFPKSWCFDSNDSLLHFAIRNYNLRKKNHTLGSIPSHQKKYRDILKLLLRPKYRKKDGFKKFFKMPFQNEEDLTALHLACHNNDVEAVEILLSDPELTRQTINLKSGDSFHRRTPYMMAYRDSQIASALQNNEFFDWRENEMQDRSRRSVYDEPGVDAYMKAKYGFNPMSGKRR